MKKLAPGLLCPSLLTIFSFSVLASDCFCPSAHATDEPMLFSTRTGVPRVPERDTDAVWSQPPDLNGLKGSSEIIGIYGLESRLADDFELLAGLYFAEMVHAQMPNPEKSPSS